MPKVLKRIVLIVLASFSEFWLLAFAWWTQRPTIIQNMIYKQASCLFGAAEDAKSSTEQFAEDFAVGKPSKDFIRKARHIDADEITVNGQTASSMGSIDFGETEIDPKLFEKHADELEKEFDKLSTGSAHIQVTIIPPFLRFNCEIDFKDGIVTRERDWKLD